MKTTVLRYGACAAISICVLFLLGWTLGKGLSIAAQEVIGYMSMVVSLSFVFFGIKHFRDQVNGGIVSFGKALRLGLLISLITAIAFGTLDVVYVKYINPDFYETYYAHMVEELRASVDEAALPAALDKLEAQKAFFGNAFMNFTLMFLTVLLIGFIISLLSAWGLQRKNNKAL